MSPSPANSPKNGASKPAEELEPKKFGTFNGVYLPSVLTILGVIMYLRLGWVLGNAGLFHTVLIVSLATFITFITGLSISAIATNMTVRGGGAYYIISRSFGPEAGAAVGLPLFLAQAIGVSFYLAGFAESLQSFFPQVPLTILALASLGGLTLLAFFSANLSLKFQFLLFLIILGSLASFFLGGKPPDGFVRPAGPLPPPAGFWLVFAVFFPAVTGILSGVSLSGDLKNPRRSLPLGTLSAVATGYLIYLAIPVFLSGFVPPDVLRTNYMILRDVATVGQLILLGLWGATLSSALSSLLGAPRTLQALAQDRLLPAFLGKGYGPSLAPRIATGVTFLLAFAATCLGNLDTIAPVLSMFLLATYGSLNLIAGVEGFMGNPSWRPVLKMPWWVPLLGALLCLGVMLMINPLATFAAVSIVGLIYVATTKRRLNPRWADMRHGLLLMLARFSIYRLAKHKTNPKSWRPNIFVLSGAPTQRWHLIQLADALTHGKGFLTVASVVQKTELDQDKIDSLEGSIRQFLSERKVPALVELNYAENFFSGARELARTYGMGPLAPNTFLFGSTEKQENYLPFAELIQYIFATRRNVVIFREEGKIKWRQGARKQIVCWWRGKENNAGFMLTLGYMLQTSPEWRGAELALKTIVSSEESREAIAAYLENFLSHSRLHATVEVLVEPTEQDYLTTTIQKYSEESDLVFLGMRPPGPEETAADYAAYFEHLLGCLQNFPPLVLVLAAEGLDFKEIFT